MDIPLERKTSLDDLPVSTKRTLLRFPRGPTKDPGEYVMKLKHVIDAGKDYKVLALTQSDSCRELLHFLCTVCLPCSK